MGMEMKSSLRRMWVSVTPREIFLNGPLLCPPNNFIAGFCLHKRCWLFKFNRDDDKNYHRKDKHDEHWNWLIYW